MISQGSLIDERFEIQTRVGAGGVGEVYRARDRCTGACVAIKALLRPEEGGDARFGREAAVLAELQHPGIVRYVKHGTTSTGELYLAMEWLEGEDLSARLARGRLAVDETVALGARVADALGAMHAQGIVHRDVKPSNLFLVGGKVEEVKVLDLGLARRDAATGLTKTGVILGTLGYMAPEQARGGQLVDARVDVFSLGCVLFECLTGLAVFRGDNIMAILAKILFEQAPRTRQLRSEVPLDLDALVARMLSKASDARPRDGAEVAALIAGAASAPCSPEQGSAPSPSPSYKEPASAVLRGGERRLCSVVLVGATTLADQTLADADVKIGMAAVRRIALAHRGQAELLADGSMVLSFQGSQIATDQAAQAARCALAVRALLPDRPVALATGRTELTGWLPIGDAIDRAAHMLAPSLGGSPAADAAFVPIDEVTARLLGPRFRVEPRDRGLVLVGEDSSSARTLLGKRTACVGRERDLALLQSLFDECVDEPLACAVLVTAKAGVGKSRLAFELVDLLRSREEPPEIWLARGDPLRVASSYALLGEALRGAAGILDGEPPDVRRSKLEARVARHVPAEEQARVAKFLGEIVGVPIFTEGATMDARQMSAQIARAFEDLARAECGAGPLLLVLEDLHWGDGPSVKLVEAMLRRVQDRPCLVLALARPEVHELFPRLWAEHQVKVHQIHLRELSRKAGERLVRQALGDAARPEVIERLHALSGGNAFYLEELIRTVAQGHAQDELPETVVAMVQARIEGLDPLTRRILQAASVFGEAFWEGGVAALLGDTLPPADLAEGLARLVAQELLCSRASSHLREPELAFRHALMREGAYAMLTEEDRMLGHRLAGEWLEQLGEADPSAGAGAKAPLLASHYQRARAHDKAFDYFLAAANAAARLFAVTDARHFYAEALAELARLPDDEARRRQRIDVTTQLVAVSWLSSAPSQTLAQMEEAEQLLQTLPKARWQPDDSVRAAKIALWGGRACHAWGRLEEALAWYEKGLERAGAEPQLTAMMAGSAGQALVLLGRVAEAKPRLEQALELLASTGAWMERCRVQGYLGMAVAALGDVPGGHRLIVESEARARDLKYSTYTALQHLYRQAIALYEEKWQTMREEGEIVVEEATRSDDLVVAYMGHRFVEWALCWLGGAPSEIEATRAAATAAYARVQASPIDDWFVVADVDALFLRGLLPEAALAAERAAAHCRASGCVSGEALAHRIWGRVESALGRHRSAIEHMAESVRISELAALRTLTTRTRLAWAEACRRAGDEAGAAEQTAASDELRR